MRQLSVILSWHICFLITWDPKDTSGKGLPSQARGFHRTSHMAKKLFPITYFHEFTTRVAFANLWDIHIGENKTQQPNSQWMLTPPESDTVPSVKTLSLRARARAQPSCDFLLMPGKGPFLHRLEKTNKQTPVSLQGLKTISKNLRRGKKHSLVIYLRKYIWEENHILKALLAKSSCSFSLWEKNMQTTKQKAQLSTEAFWNHSGWLVFWKLLSSSAIVFI